MCLILTFEAKPSQWARQGHDVGLGVQLGRMKAEDLHGLCRCTVDEAVQPLHSCSKLSNWLVFEKKNGKVVFFFWINLIKNRIWEVNQQQITLNSSWGYMLQYIRLSWPSNSLDCRISWSILWLLCKQLPSFLLRGKYANIYPGLTPALLQQELFCMIRTAVEHRNKDTRPLCYKANIYCTQGQQNITRCKWLVISSPMILSHWW